MQLCTSGACLLASLPLSLSKLRHSFLNVINHHHHLLSGCPFKIYYEYGNFESEESGKGLLLLYFLFLISLISLTFITVYFGICEAATSSEVGWGYSL